MDSGVGDGVTYGGHVIISNINELVGGKFRPGCPWAPLAGGNDASPIRDFGPDSALARTGEPWAGRGDGSKAARHVHKSSGHSPS